jgi:GntR family transcriptional regulator
VNPHGLQIRSRLEEIWSYEQMLRDHGYTPSVRVVTLSREPAGAGAAADLRVDRGTPLLVMEKLFLEDDVPVVLTRNRISADRIDLEPGEADAAAPIFEFLDRHSANSLSYYLSDLVPAVLDERRAGLLGVPPGTAALSFEEVGYDAAAQPVVQSVSHFRDDLVRFRLMRRRSPA